MRFYPILLIILIISILIFTGCDWNRTRENIEFTAQGCDPRAALDEQSIRIDVQEHDVILRHEAVYPCCGNFTFRLDERGALLDLYEINTGETCGCLCSYTIDASLLNIPEGEYILNLYGPEGIDGVQSTLILQDRLKIPERRSDKIDLEK